MAPPDAPPSRRRRLVVVLALALLVAIPPANAASEASVTGAVHVSPITVALELSASSIRLGEALTARLTATNLGDESVRAVTLSIRFEPVGLLQKGATSLRLNQLKAGRSAEVSFRLCGAAVGSYLVLAQAELEGSTIESPARLLEVTDGRHAKC